jgi:hypothetical protein
MSASLLIKKYEITDQKLIKLLNKREKAEMLLRNINEIKKNTNDLLEKKINVKILSLCKHPQFYVDSADSQYDRDEYFCVICNINKREIKTINK